MSPIINISEAKATLSQLLAKVVSGESIIIGKAGKPIAKIVPFRPDEEPRVLGGSWSGAVEMAGDFDDLPQALLDAFNGSHDESSS
ncbi:MAG: type II toxin-antitoxin system Phd/YefM family antitoxin [Deltaproteobacteria bacterium]|nr:type II toxin-antitoxin system Phd/YefM family antitoxin [Deltaproteobacteria bacterium]